MYIKYRSISRTHMRMLPIVLVYYVYSLYCKTYVYEF